MDVLETTIIVAPPSLAVARASCLRSGGKLPPRQPAGGRRYGYYATSFDCYFERG